jgi:thioredoxin-related protein
MMKKYYCLLLITLSVSLNSQEENGLVKWMTFKEAQEKNKQFQKPFIIDIYTDWCGWCKHMMKTTYSNEAIAGYINNNFYPVKFNAEGKDTIEYNGKIYKPTSPEPRTAHELAIKFLGTRLSYPSTMFITNNFEYNLLIPGYIEDKKIEPMLVFMVENAWRTTQFEEFNKHFTHTFTDTVFSKQPLKLYPITEIEALQKKKPKKVLVNIGAEFCNTCMMMTKTTFPDSAMASYINKNFYMVNFNATNRDTIIFKNEKYFNTMINNFPLHTLALKLSNNKFSLPVLCMLDEQLNTIDALNFYQSPERMRPIIEFIATNSYKSKTFNDFMQEYLKEPVKKDVPKKKKK